MKKPEFENVIAVIFVTCVVIVVLLCVAFLVFYIWLMVQYSGKTVDEIPFWVLWFLR